MFLQLVLIFTSSLVASLAITIVYEFTRSNIAYIRFKRKLSNIKFLDEDRKWFGNQMDSFRGVKGCQAFDERHKKYGDTLGFMVQCLPAISTIDLDLIKRIVIDKASVNINRIHVSLALRELDIDCIFTCENEQWRRIRRSFAPALKPARFKSPNVIFEVESTINKLIGSIERKFGQEKSCELNVEDLMRRYSLQLVLSCLYKQDNLINFDLNQQCQWVKMVDHGLEEVRDNIFFRLASNLPSLRHIVDWLSYRFHPIGEWRKLVVTFIKQQAMLGLEARKKLTQMRSEQGDVKVDENNFTLDDGRKFRRNMTDFIVDEFLLGKMNTSEYVNSSFLLFSAADKTASDSLVHTLYQLALNQDIQCKLRNSVQAHGIQSEYLSWIINESLRLNPTVPQGCTRTICEPIELKQGGTLEPGTVVFTNAFTIHRLKKYWGQDADEFRPERWAQAASFHPSQFIPFGAGIRRCPGREFALFEMKSLISSIIKRYNLECQIKEDLMEFDSPYFIMNLQKTPLYVKFTKLAPDV